MALIYIFKYPQPGQKDRINNPSTGSAREEDIAIAMSQFSCIYMLYLILFRVYPKYIHAPLGLCVLLVSYVQLGCTIFACNAYNWVAQQLYQSRAASKILGNLFLQKVWETGSHVIASACAAQPGVWDTKVSHGSSLSLSTHCIFVSFLSTLYFPLYLIL